MIERYTINFGPAVSQKELEKALNEGKNAPQVHQMKARIELTLDYKDLRTIDAFIKHMQDMDREAGRPYC